LYCNDNQLTSLDLGNNIDLTNLYLLAGNNDANLVIKVGNGAGRVALATSLFTTANGSISAGTTFTI